MQGAITIFNSRKSSKALSAILTGTDDSLSMTAVKLESSSVKTVSLPSTAVKFDSLFDGNRHRPR